MSTVKDVIMDPTTQTRLPVEILEHAMSFINDTPTLKAFCLVGCCFVRPAQSRIFACLNLTTKYMDAAGLETLRCIVRSPHLMQHVWSVITYFEHEGLVILLNSFPDPAFSSHARLRELRFFPMEFEEAPHRLTFALLRSFRTKVYPFLTSLALESLDVPLALIAECTSLRCLHTYNTVLCLEGEEAFPQCFRFLGDENVGQLAGLLSPSPELVSMPLLKTLALGGTRNPGDTLCPLVSLIQNGRFSGLRYLDLGRREISWFPTRDIEKVVKPLMNQLEGINIGYWFHWDALDVSEDSRGHLDSFQIHHYPNLRHFSTRFEDTTELVSENRGLFLRLVWLVESFERLTSPHPLEILELRLSQEWVEGNPTSDDNLGEDVGPEYIATQEIWDKLDATLSENEHLKKLWKVVVPIHPQFIAMRQLFLRYLKRLSDAGKLSFEPIEMQMYP